MFISTDSYLGAISWNFSSYLFSVIIVVIINFGWLIWLADQYRWLDLIGWWVGVLTGCWLVSWNWICSGAFYSALFYWWHSGFSVRTRIRTIRSYWWAWWNIFCSAYIFWHKSMEYRNLIEQHLRADIIGKVKRNSKRYKIAENAYSFLAHSLESRPWLVTSNQGFYIFLTRLEYLVRK